MIEEFQKLTQFLWFSTTNLLVTLEMYIYQSQSEICMYGYFAYIKNTVTYTFNKSQNWNVFTNGNIWNQLEKCFGRVLLDSLLKHSEEGQSLEKSNQSLQSMSSFVISKSDVICLTLSITSVKVRCLTSSSCKYPEKQMQERTMVVK